MSAEHSSSLLVDYFKTFLEDRDIEAFRERVAAQLQRGDARPHPRRLAVCRGAASRSRVAGIIGQLRAEQRRAGKVAQGQRRRRAGYGRTRALDRLVPRRYPENNLLLDQVRNTIRNQQLNEAETLANRLIHLAPISPRLTTSGRSFTSNRAGLPKASKTAGTF